MNAAKIRQGRMKSSNRFDRQRTIGRVLIDLTLNALQIRTSTKNLFETTHARDVAAELQIDRAQIRGEFDQSVKVIESQPMKRIGEAKFAQRMIDDERRVETEERRRVDQKFDAKFE